MPNTDRALVIFIKNPEKGKVKTRLAATVGDDRALAIYISLMNHTRDVTLASSARRCLFYSEQIKEQDDWPSDQFHKYLQATGDLGQKIEAAFEQGFQSAGKVMIVGSDCPQLSPELIEEGFKALEQKDFVLGPALDGGYYLIGMRRFLPQVFHNISWSTEQVADQTRAKIKALGASCHELPALSDIDYEEDWIKYGWEV